MRKSDPARGPHILTVAAKLFDNRRYHEVRMEDVALEAGVAKGTLYRYFKDKEDLYLGLILAAFEQVYREVESAIANAGRPEDKILIFLRRSVEFFGRHPYYVDLIQRVEGSDPRRLAPLQASRQRFFRLAGDLIRELNGTGRFHADNVEIAALALTGMTRQVLRFYPKPWPKDLAEILVRQFLNGLTCDAREKRNAPRRNARDASRSTRRRQFVA